jgi:hypothetical protein
MKVGDWYVDNYTAMALGEMAIAKVTRFDKKSVDADYMLIRDNRLMFGYSKFKQMAMGKFLKRYAPIHEAAMQKTIILLFDCTSF